MFCILTIRVNTYQTTSSPAAEQSAHGNNKKQDIILYLCIVYDMAEDLFLRLDKTLLL